MEKPKCRLCGGKHLLSEAHEFELKGAVKVRTRDEGTARSLAARAVGGRVARTAAKPVPNTNPLGAKKKAAERSARWRAAHVEHYWTYMRNYMRERRRLEKG
jgi:hypothetical protein